MSEVSCLLLYNIGCIVLLSFSLFIAFKLCIYIYIYIYIGTETNYVTKLFNNPNLTLSYTTHNSTVSFCLKIRIVIIKKICGNKMPTRCNR